MTQRVLVTGASSGIGKALALALAERGCHLALTARRAERLAATAREARSRGAAAVLELVGSVTSEADVRAHHAELVRAFGEVDLAILNAGIGLAREDGVFASADYAATLDTNVLGVCRWIEALLPGFRSARRGTLAVVASPAGWAGFPTIGPYAASKAALAVLLQALRIEERDAGVRVVTVEPGYVESEITARNDPKDMPIVLPADAAARRILRGLDRGAAVIRFPRRLVWPLRLLTSLPRGLFEVVALLALRRRRRAAQASLAARSRLP